MEDSVEAALASEVGAALTVGAALDAKMLVRNYLSSQMLWSARIAADDCRKLEESLIADGWDRPTHPDHRSLALTAVLTSVGFLEAWVNEAYQDVADGQAGRTDGLSSDCKAAMKEVWEAGEQRLPLLTKANLALVFAGRERFDKGRAPYQDAQLLVELRNACVHFKPETHDFEDPRALDKRLPGRLDKSGLLREDDGSSWNIWALASPGAEWALVTAKTFADEWSDRMGIPRLYEDVVRSFEAARSWPPHEA